MDPAAKALVPLAFTTKVRAIVSCVASAHMQGLSTHLLAQYARLTIIAQLVLHSRPYVHWGTTAPTVVLSSNAWQDIIVALQA